MKSSWVRLFCAFILPISTGPRAVFRSRRDNHGPYDFHQTPAGSCWLCPSALNVAGTSRLKNTSAETAAFHCRKPPTAFRILLSKIATSSWRYHQQFHRQKCRARRKSRGPSKRCLNHSCRRRLGDRRQVVLTRKTSAQAQAQKGARLGAIGPP